MINIDPNVVSKWERALTDIENKYVKEVTAQLMENQAAAIMLDKLKEEQAAINEDAPTTVGKLGTFQKFAFPVIKRTYPKLIANFIVGVQPMPGPVSQIFYLGSTRVGINGAETLYSKYKLTYKGQVSQPIFSGANLSGAQVASGFNLSAVLGNALGSPSTTFGGDIAAFPNSATILGYSVSTGENLSGAQIPEMNIHIEQQPVVARTRKMRALWTIEASQDLKAYHNMNLESELTSLLSQELKLEIDRELIEDLRMLAYNPSAAISLWNVNALDNPNSNSFGQTGTLHPAANATGTEGFIPVNYLYDFALAGSGNPFGTDSNVFAIDFSYGGGLNLSPLHLGHVYANLLALINFVSQDVYKTTHRGPATWMLTSPIIGALLESAAKMEGGIAEGKGPTNMNGTSIDYKGRFANKYDLYIDPLYPEDEILMGYKGSSPMDAGFMYCPYIPMQQLPVIHDPQTFQPRKGLLTRYGKAAVAPASRFYRVIRIVGPVANFLFLPFGKNTAGNALQ